MSARSLPRVEETYECPDCGSTELYSPTYRQRKCCSCGHRGSESSFAVHRTPDCPECGTSAIRTHTDGTMEAFTCRSCFERFRV